jgi:hypothetical protein
MSRTIRFDSQARIALFVAAIVLVGGALGSRAAMGHWRVHLQKKPVDLREPLADIPRRLADGRWIAVGDDAVLAKEVVEELGTELYLDRVYERQTRDGAPARLSLHVAYYTGLIDAVPHVPERCLVAAGWSQVGKPVKLELDVDRSAWRDDEIANRKTGEPYPIVSLRHYVRGDITDVRLPIGSLHLNTSAYQLAKDPRVHLLAGYLFIANGRTTPSAFGVRSLAFDKTDEFAYYCKLQFSMSFHESEDVSEAEFAELIADLMPHLLPELMRCLPDWAEVESRSASESSPAF